MNIGIYVYEQAEVLDFSGPFEVFSTANRVTDKNECKAFNVYLISEHGGLVNARAGFKVITDYSINTHPELDVLVVVGGVHDDEMHKQQILDWLVGQDKKVPIIASFCTGAFILAQAGLLTNQEVTTHWQDIPKLRATFPNLTVVDHVRWLDKGKYITSGGISAGIDMSLHIVSRLMNEIVAEKTAKQMEFCWTKNS